MTFVSFTFNLGDTVWYIDDNRIIKAKITAFFIDNSGVSVEPGEGEFHVPVTKCFKTRAAARSYLKTKDIC